MWFLLGDLTWVEFKSHEMASGPRWACFVNSQGIGGDTQILGLLQACSEKQLASEELSSKLMACLNGWASLIPDPSSGHGWDYLALRGSVQQIWVAETLPLVSVVSLDVDIYRTGQVQMTSDKQAKVRLPGEARGPTDGLDHIMSLKSNGSGRLGGSVG